MSQPLEPRGPWDKTQEQCDRIWNAVRGLLYGEVTVVIHQGKIQEIRVTKRER